MTSAGAAIDQLLQARRSVLLTYKEPRREVHGLHREKRLGSLEISYQLFNSVQQSERPLFISLDTRWEEMAMERQRKKARKRARNAYAPYANKYHKKHRRKRTEDSENQKSKQDKVLIRTEQTLQEALKIKPDNIDCKSNLVQCKNKETEGKKKYNGEGSNVSKKNNTICTVATTFSNNDNFDDVNKQKHVMMHENESSSGKEKRKATSRYSLQQLTSTKIAKAATTLSLATAAKHALMHSGHQKSASTYSISAKETSVPKVTSSKHVESEQFMSMTNNKYKNTKIGGGSNSLNKEIVQEKSLQLNGTKKLLTPSRTELPKRRWTARKIRSCLLKIKKAVSLRRHWRVRDFVLCSSNNNTRKKKTSKLIDDKNHSSTCTRQGNVRSVKAKYTALMLRQRRDTLIQSAFSQSMQNNTEETALSKEVEQSKNCIHTKNDDTVDVDNPLKQTELSKTSLVAIHSFWSIVKSVLAQRQASLQSLLHSLQTTHNDHIDYNKKLKFCAARSYPLFGALVKLEWVHYVKPTISLGKHKRRRATLQIIKVQYGIVIHEMLRTLEVALLPTSRLARERLINWLTCSNCNQNNTTITIIEKVKCPVKGANTCSVTKLYATSSGTRGSAVKKMSRKLRSQGGSINKEMHVDIMCSYVGEVVTNVINAIQKNDIDNIIHNSIKNHGNDKPSEQPQCEQHNNHDMNNSANLLARLRNRYL